MPIFTLAAVTLAANAAHAQIEEIVVTARKTEERLQDVPLSISAFTADAIARRSIQDLEDIALLTPGLSFEDYSNGGFGTPVIRGASQLRIQDLDQNVAVFLDGIYLPRQYTVDVGMLDMERIEVVKGPQSALYGRNSFMGAINYITQRPGSDFEFKGEATAGGHGRYDAIGSMGGPIVGDVVSARVAIGKSKFGGDFPNGHPNAGVEIDPGSPGRLGGWDKLGAIVSLAVKPSDQVQLDFNYYHFENQAEVRPTTRIQATFNDLNCSRNAAGRNNFFCGELPNRYTPPPGGAPNTARAVIDPRAFFDVDTDGYRAALEWDLSDQFRFNYLYGRIESDVAAVGIAERDHVLGRGVLLAGVPILSTNNTPNGDVAFDSHEFRLNYDNNASFKAMAGTFIEELKDNDIFTLGSIPRLGTQPIDPIASPNTTILTRTFNNNTSWSVFGQVQASFMDDQARFTAEGRHVTEKKRLRSGPTTFNAVVVNFARTYKYFTPRATLDYKLSPDQLLYASIAKGTKSGGFNATVFDERQRAFDPDKNWTFEVGSKNTFADNSIQLNVSLFYIDWSNLQINTTPTGLPPNVVAPAIVGNLGGATSYGIETEGIFQLTEELSLNAGFSHAAPTYKSGVFSQRIALTTLCDGIACPRNADVSGNTLPRQSKTQGNIGAMFESDFNDSLGYYIRGDAAYQSKQFVEELNLGWVPSRTIVNASVGLTGENWQASLWAKNLFDKEYIANSFFTAVPADTVYTPAFGPKRTWGLTFRVNY
ncbi:MAG: TonB-dependent receptor [Rhodospirillaceae bacterium]|nr:TonB-dependent receptor [Rhodospirillaceae bacterium]